MNLSDGSCRIPLCLLHHRSVWEESRDINTSATQQHLWSVFPPLIEAIFKGGVHNFGPRHIHDLLASWLSYLPDFDVSPLYTCAYVFWDWYICLLIGETSLFPGKSAGWEWTCEKNMWRKRERNVEAMPFEIFFNRISLRLFPFWIMSVSQSFSWDSSYALISTVSD